MNKLWKELRCIYWETFVVLGHFISMLTSESRCHVMSRRVTSRHVALRGCPFPVRPGSTWVNWKELEGTLNLPFSFLPFLSSVYSNTHSRSTFFQNKTSHQQQSQHQQSKHLLFPFPGHFININTESSSISIFNHTFGTFDTSHHHSSNRPAWP